MHLWLLVESLIGHVENLETSDISETSDFFSEFSSSEILILSIGSKSKSRNRKIRNKISYVTYP